jgi:hypothetical protein
MHVREVEAQTGLSTLQQIARGPPHAGLGRAHSGADERERVWGGVGG